MKFAAGKLATTLLFLALPLAGQAPGTIQSILENRIDEGKKAVGIVAGTIDQSGRQVIGYGRLSKSDSRKPDGDTVFEIGSITKVFTSLILADMVEKGEVQLDDPVAKYLPEWVKVPSRGGKQITLRDLSMQVSGLPRMPTNFKPADPDNPYVDYDTAKLYEFLSGYTLPRDPGQKYEYSNVAVGLLGNTLARRAGVDYETLVRKRILDPLKMTRTSIKLSDAQKKNFAWGHDAALMQVKNWDMDALAGAGALRSTANDMLTFLAANLELIDSPLKAAMRRMRAEHRETGAPDLEIALGWHIWTRFDTDLVWHNGGTAGYRSFAGFDPKTKKGAVVLCNTSFDNDDLGRHLVVANYPAEKYAAAAPEVALDAKVLGAYPGKYEVGGATMTVTADDGHLYVQITGQPRFEVFAKKPDEFFLKVIDAQLSFVRDDSGAVKSLILHQNGRDIPWSKSK